VNTVLDGLDSSLADVLGGRLVATYVHGSLALGGFEPTRSDIDVLVIVRDSPRTGAAEWHELAKRVPVTGAAARGVELSVVELGAVAKPAAPWPFLLHVTTAPDDRKVIDGRRRAGDHDLLMHYVFARAAGQVGRGPPPADLIGDVDRRSVLRYLRDELDWGLRHAGETYAVLNAGRAVRYARDGVVVSKLAGARAALAAGAPPQLVERAVAVQTGRAADRPPDDEARRFVAAVRAELAAAAAGSVHFSDEQPRIGSPGTGRGGVVRDRGRG